MGPSFFSDSISARSPENCRHMSPAADFLRVCVWLPNSAGRDGVHAASNRWRSTIQRFREERFMRSTLKATLLIVPSLIAWAGAAFADPPAHAPAHGWRKKHDPYYVGYTGVSWERDYDISSGRCNRQEIATVVGAIA